MGSGGYAFVVNGKADGSARVDAGTQVMLALIGSILHPNPKQSLVIGLGTGSSAGWLGAIPSMERVDVVELEPIVLDVARQSHLVNQDVLNNPKVHLHIGDAREVLLTTNQRYDLIASEPSNPFRAGVASLFTQESTGRPTTGCPTTASSCSGCRPTASTPPPSAPCTRRWPRSSRQWKPGRPAAGDIVLLGSKQPPVYDLPRIAARIQEEPYPAALRVAWRSSGLDGFLARYVAGDRLARAIAATPGVQINTDDRNIVEFGFARSLGRDYQMVAQIRALAQSVGASRPPVDATAVDWSAVDMAWVSQIAAEGGAIQVNPRATAANRSRQGALIHYYREDHLEAARAAWAQQGEPPADQNETAMVAEIQASVAAPEAMQTIERLRQFHSGEADVMLAELRFAQRDVEGAAAALESAFATFRRDPWALPRFTQKAVARAQILGAASPTIARRMIDAMREPFAVKVAGVPAAARSRPSDDSRRFRDAVHTRRRRPGAERAVGERLPPASPPLLRGDRRQPSRRRDARCGRVFCDGRPAARRERPFDAACHESAQRNLPRGLAPRTSPHALSRAASTARSVSAFAESSGETSP